MKDKQKYAIKLAIDTMDKHASRYWNTSYGSRKTGVTVGYGEAISILSDMVRDNDNKPTNADRIRNMSDEELADVLFDSCLEVMELEECTNTDNCVVCKRCVLEWLQSEAE